MTQGRNWKFAEDGSLVIVSKNATGDAAILTCVTSGGTEVMKVASGGITGTVTVPDTSISTAKIIDNAVTTAKIADANVTFAKLALTIGASLPTANPGAGKLWNDAGTVKVGT